MKSVPYVFVTICCKNSIHEECFIKCVSTCMGKCPFCRVQFLVTYEKEIESTRIQYLVFMATLLCMAFFAAVIFFIHLENIRYICSGRGMILLYPNSARNDKNLSFWFSKSCISRSKLGRCFFKSSVAPCKI